MESEFSLTKIFSEFKYSIRLALPLIASEVIYGLNSFISVVMVSHLSKTELAANALVWGIYVAVSLFFIGIISAVGILVSQSYGAEDPSGISVCFKQGLVMAVIFTLPMIIIMWLSPIILMWTGQDPEVIKFAKPLFYSLILSILPSNIMILIYNFLLGINKTRITMFMSFFIVPIEIFFYYIFLYGKLHSPKFGLAGIGYSMAVSNAITVIFFLGYFHLAKEIKIYNLFSKWWKLNKKFLLELLRIGLPMGTMFCLEVYLFAAVAMMMGSLGINVLAAYQISHQYLMIGLFFIFGLTQTAAVRIGNEVGRNNRAALRLAGLVNIGIGLGFSSLLSIFYLFFPKLAISIDLDIKSAFLQPVINEATKFLAIVAVLILIDTVRLISLGSLRGLKDTKFPLYISIFGFWVIGFSSIYLLAFKLKLGGTGIWWGVVIGLLVTGIILFIRFNILIKRINLVSLVTKVSNRHHNFN